MSQAQRILSRRSFLGLQAATLCTMLSGCSAGHDEEPPAETTPAAPRTLDEIRASGMLRVGLYSDSKPLSYINSKGNFSGLDGYLCPFITEHSGLGIDYVAIDPPARYNELTSGAVDVCLAEMSPSDASSDDVTFTRPVFRLQLGLASPSSHPIESVEQLAEGELIVCEGTYAAQYAQDIWPEVKLRPYQTMTDARVALEGGKGIALLADEIDLACWTKSHKDFALSMKAIGDPRYVAPAVAAGQDELLSLLDDILSKFISGGYSRKAYDKLVKPYVPDGYDSMLCKNDEVVA